MVASLITTGPKSGSVSPLASSSSVCSGRTTPALKMSALRPYFGSSMQTGKPMMRRPNAVLAGAHAALRQGCRGRGRRARAAGGGGGGRARTA